MRGLIPRVRWHAHVGTCDPRHQGVRHTRSQAALAFIIRGEGFQPRTGRGSGRLTLRCCFAPHRTQACEDYTVAHLKRALLAARHRNHHTVDAADLQVAQAICKEGPHVLRTPSLTGPTPRQRQVLATSSQRPSRQTRAPNCCHDLSCRTWTPPAPPRGHGPRARSRWPSPSSARRPPHLWGLWRSIRHSKLCTALVWARAGEMCRGGGGRRPIHGPAAKHEQLLPACSRWRSYVLLEFCGSTPPTPAPLATIQVRR